jgi:AbrB family looped-hinge helix DNA binding protein
MTPRSRAIWATWARIDSRYGKTQLTEMGVEIRISSKGQVVIPKDVRDRRGWPQGSRLEMIETSDGVLLRTPQEDRPRITIEEATAKLRKLYRHKGPPIPIEKLSWPVDFYDVAPGAKRPD